MIQYADLVGLILGNGTKREDRTGTGTLSVFGHQMRFNLAEGFPLLTMKRTPFKAIAHELLWFLSGSTNVKPLQDVGVTIWDEWAGPDGELGPIYGSQWRSWGAWGYDGAIEGVDQIHNVIEDIFEKPFSRRLVVSAWNVEMLHAMRLAPCHAMFQFYVAEGRLSCHVFQRSADVFLGVPFNIASYALLTHMVAQVTGLKAGDLVWSGSDCHLYLNHVDQARELLSRPADLPLPDLVLQDPLGGIDEYTIDHMSLSGYSPLPHIPAPVAI